jgi:shikimate dehydrogenase
MTKTIHAGVIGWPIEHSRSPMIHGHWLKRHGIDGAYTKQAVKPEDFSGFVRGFAARGFAGANITVPHKEAAFALADVVEPDAKAVGAANTLWLEGGKLHATNTDTYGFMTHLGKTVPDWKARDRPVAILGAGGSARTIAYGFLQAGVSEVRLFNRTRDRADAVAAHFGTKVKVHDWFERDKLISDACVLVNTTTLGMAKSSPLDISLSTLRSDAVVADIVYVPLETQLLKQAAARGLRTVDGLGMLLHQAVPGFAKWFGVRPEVTAELRDLVVRDL